MKKLIFAISVVALAACGGEKKENNEAENTESEATEETAAEAETEEAPEASVSLAGKYQLESVSGEELTEKEKEATIEFKADGTCVMTRGGREESGTWTLSEDGKTITCKHGEKSEEWSDVEMSEGKLMFSMRDDRITFKKL